MRTRTEELTRRDIVEGVIQALVKQDARYDLLYDEIVEMAALIADRLLSL